MVAVFTPAASAATPVITIAASGASRAMTFAATGDAAFDVTLSANCTFTLSGGTAGQYQRITLIVRQPASGTTYTATLPPQSSNMRYNGGAPPATSTTLGSISLIDFFTSDGGLTVLGE